MRKIRLEEHETLSIFKEVCDSDTGQEIDCWCRPDWICDNRCAAFLVEHGQVKCMARNPPVLIGELSEPNE